MIYDAKPVVCCFSIKRGTAKDAFWQYFFSGFFCTFEAV
jgi:hypothetical protein